MSSLTSKTKHIVAICGIKNSGKTTLIRKLIPRLNSLGYRVATIKHDGHEFESDVPGTDSYYHQKAGAYATAVYSKSQFMITKKIEGITNEMLMEFFPEADLIFIEGCKECEYPKIEVIRSVNGNEPASNPKGRFLIATDILDYKTNEPYTSLDDIDTITQAIIQRIGKEGNNK
ncbi:MAG: molybdopterin-guanine dinucleotide biosynthesis protein B [Clostridium sp.]|nr:molybdopterin-guanine dinucleotide biosynthesis protein B [Clostridium sp.]